MYPKTATYQNIFASDNHRFEAKININGTDYGEDKILSAKSVMRLFDNDPTIGGTYSGTFEFTILESSSSIPRMAKVIPYWRITNGTSTSPWYKRGEYYIDTRESSRSRNMDGTVYETFTAYCYDNMMLANEVYSNSSLTWPATDIQVVNEIASKMGVSLRSGTANTINQGYTIQLPVGYTMREVLGYIAAMYGASWCCDWDGKLRLIKLNEYDESRTVNDAVERLDLGVYQNPYTKVVLNTSENTYVESGSTDDIVLEATCPYATQTIVDNVYTALSSFYYYPFEATGVWCDPALELSDQVNFIGAVRTVFSITTYYGSAMVMDLAAPKTNEADHEYVFESPSELEYKRTVGSLNSSITLAENKISLVVEEVGGTNVIKAASIVTAINDSGSSVIINADKIDLQGYVTFTNLSTPGQTTIDGGNIVTNTITATQISSAVFDDINSTIEAGDNNIYGQASGFTSSQINLVRGEIQEQVTRIDDLVNGGVQTVAQSVVTQTTEGWDARITRAQNTANGTQTLLDAHFDFTGGGLKISGTENSQSGSYLNLAADEVGLYANGTKRLWLNANGANAETFTGQTVVATTNVKIGTFIWEKYSGGFRLIKE